MTPWFTPCCGLAVALAEAAGAELLPAELGFAPELVLATAALCPPDAVPLLFTGATDVLPLLDGVDVPDVGALIGVPAAEPLLEGAV
jgi:hypothetical protein